MQLSIIIVNYNVKYFVEQCLYSVLKASKNIDTEIFVIDNDSTDGSQQFFFNKFESVQFIWNWKNVGFSKANNIALQQAKGKYILFLNPDTLVPEDCFEKCLAFFESAKDIGALGIRMIDGTGKFLKESKRGFPGLLTSFFKLSGLAALFPRSSKFARYYAGHLPEDQNNVVDILAGAFMMVEKKVLDKTGVFDEEFFMYGEDIDLSYRIQNAGYKNYYFSESTIIHFKGESTKKDSLHYVEIFYGAMGLFVKKHYKKFKGTVYSIFIHAAIWLKIVSLFFKKIKSSKIKKINIANTSSTLIVAEEEDYESVIRILKKANLKMEIIGRVDLTQLSSGNSLGNLRDLAELISRHNIKNVIFCINQLSVKEIINIIQTINSAVSYQFHVAGSSAIVGSGNNISEAIILLPLKKVVIK